MRHLLILILLAITLKLNAQDAKFTLSGYVKDTGTGEELIGANVVDLASGSGTVTNLYGFYSLTLPAGNYQIEFSYIGYASKTVNVNLQKDQTLNIEIDETSIAMKEVVVLAQKENRNVEEVSMSREKMSIEKIKSIPVVLGETDVLKAIQLLPGVQTVGEGQSGFFVRGGGSDQNLLLLDEAPVYNASHLLGFFSVFNSDAIKDVQLYKGGIPASYGGRMSSVLDIRMKDGNNKQFSGSGGIGTVSSRLTLEGPIVKDEGSFVVSGRRTYVDMFLKMAANSDSTLKDATLYFYDLNLKANYRLSEKDRVFLSGYFGKDVFGDNGIKLSWGNATGTVRWNHVFNNRLFSNLTFIYSEFDYFLGQTDDVFGFKWDSQIRDLSAKADFNYYIAPGVSLKFGYQGIRHSFQPGYARGSADDSVLNPFKAEETVSLEHGVYVENEMEISSALSVVYGMRFSAFQNIGAATVYDYDTEYNVIDSTTYGAGEVYNTYYNFEPRAGLRLKLDDKRSLKASYNHMVQYMHLASNSQSSSPLDIWLPSSPNLKPQLADQVALGYFQNFRNNAYEASVEIYYKTIENALDFKDYAKLLLNDKIEGELRFGEARAYGTEFMVKKNKGKLTGWLSYTLSKSERRIEEINDGNWYSTNYDKTHDLSLVMNYELSKRSSFSLNMVYGTGAPFTYPTGRFNHEGKVLPIYSDRNAGRMPDFHRMDVGYTLKNKEKAGRKLFWDLNFSIYNVYNRHNPYTVTFKEDEDKPGETYAEKTYIFPILPSATWNFKF